MSERREKEASRNFETRVCEILVFLRAAKMYIWAESVNRTAPHARPRGVLQAATRPHHSGPVDT